MASAINAPYFGLSQNGELSLWCENRGQLPDGSVAFWVINGHWDGTFKDGIVTIGIDGRKQPAQLCWMGSVPFNYEDYNEAMAFIRQLNWSEKMTTAPVTLNDVLLENKVVESNSNVMNIAARLKQMDEESSRHEAALEKLREKRNELVAIAEDEDALGDTTRINKALGFGEYSHK